MTDKTFSAPGKFYRGNLHTHSTNSDGVLAPQEVCRRYKAEGYDFIALTDHFLGIYDYPMTDTRAFRDDNFTTIIGAELHSGAMHNGELWHILAVGLPFDFKPPNAPAFVPVDDQESGSEIAQRAVDAGAFVAIAHPQWSGMNLSDAQSITAAHAVEVYNHGCAMGCDRPDGFHTLDLLLSTGRKLSLCATDDAHFSEPDHFGGWVMVKSEENTPEALVTALKAGNYYSSQGPEIHDLQWGEKTVKITTSAASSIVLQGHGCAAFAVHGNSMTKTEIPYGRCKSSPWMRISVIDSSGKRAWTNPHWKLN